MVKKFGTVWVKLSVFGVDTKLITLCHIAFETKQKKTNGTWIKSALKFHP